MDWSFRIGIHSSIAGSYLNALESARKLGCNALQIFSASPRMWQGGSARIPDVDAQAFRARRGEVRVGALGLYAHYLVQLAGPPPMLWARAVPGVHHEIVGALGLRGGFFVVDPGVGGVAE